MNKQNDRNLLRALLVEKYLWDIFGNALDVAYSPDSGAMRIHYRDSRTNALKNVVESVKRVMGKTSGPARYFGGKKHGVSGARLEFDGGFAVMIIHVEAEVNYVRRSNQATVAAT